MTGQIHHTCAPEEGRAILDQVERILHSSQFNGSESLRNLLAYLAKRAIERPGESVKEYELAVDVLGRDRDFDPRFDSAVRVHSARLRAKLAEYYMAQGAEDSFVIEVPKGMYRVTWRIRGAHGEKAEPEIDVPDCAAVPPRRLAWKSFWMGAAAAAALSGIVLAGFSLAAPHPAAAIQTFWRPFLGASPAPLVVFSNPRLVGTSATGLRRFHEGTDSPSEVNDTYSGTGTVVAVEQIGDLFSHFHRSIRLKRAELLTWDEAQTTNLILVGSPASNSRLRELPPLQYFDFNVSAGGIVNLHPHPGEAPVYYASAFPYTSDYAVIAMVPGLKPGQRIIVLAGTNTYGVQAAAEFICRADLVSDLLSRIEVRSNGQMPDFEALIQVKVSRGVPLYSRLVLVKPRQKSGW